MHCITAYAMCKSVLKDFFQSKFSQDRKAVNSVTFIHKTIPFTQTLGQSANIRELEVVLWEWRQLWTSPLDWTTLFMKSKNLPLPSHTPIKLFQHFDSTPLLLKIGLTRTVLSQRNCRQGRLQLRWLSQKKPQLHLCNSWAVSQIPIKNLHFPKNSEQLSPKMSRCWALLSEKARAFSKWNRLFNIKNSK